MKKLLRKYRIQVLCFYVFAFMVASAVLVSCEQNDLEIQQDFPFEVVVMPVPKELAKGETVEIRLQIKSTGQYKDNRYSLRYFQFDGKGVLGYLNSKPFKSNDNYSIPDLEFRLYYKSESVVSQSFDVWFSDSFGNEKQVSFQFNNIN
ncbi:DUF3872 domain-containing protein [Sphingobacterium sp.]|uniref:DUF3872 domain-containing protein n=1 Tax=Sphingobacterium sp. TaxID=341027 RepID=UPI00258642BC|nr:DUF3872 domain-containing protein [Sphingobacterium sp.]WET69066.1 MAG: DUF3872 domain-containing protein [Sphingobacterium sp.]